MITINILPFIIVCLSSFFIIYFDVRYKKIPLSYVYIPFLLCLITEIVFMYYTNNWTHYVYSVAGAIMLVVGSYMLYLGKVFGGGDVRLMGLLGFALPYTSFRSLIFMPIIFIVVASTLGLYLRAGKKKHIPFAPILFFIYKIETLYYITILG